MKNRIFVLLLLMMALASGAAAQGVEAPLILWIRGDLYRAAEPGAAPTAITVNGTISGPSLSPDGTRIAYKAAAPLGLEALDRVSADGFIADFDLPGDTYLLDLASGESVAVAVQPADASLLVEGAADRAIIRSTPVWSPDGMRIAWTQYVYPGGTPEIIVHDLTSDAVTLAASIPAPLVQGAAPPLKWGSGGIAVNVSTDTASDQSYLIYDSEEGRLLSQPRLAAVAGDPVVDFVWVEGVNQLGLLYQSSGWIFIDPTSGVAQAASELPRLTTSANASKALRFGVDADAGFFWEVVGETAAAPGSPAQVALSPSGQQIAFIGFPSSGAVSIWSNGETTAVSGTGSNLDQLQVGALLWGYTYWVAGR